MDIVTEEDLELLDPEVTYYENIKPDQCQKPYFIWTCEPTILEYVIQRLTQAIQRSINGWNLNFTAEVQVITIKPNIYHLIVTNCFHPNGLVAQEFRDEVLKQLDKTITSLLTENKENPRTAIRNVAFSGPDITHSKAKLLSLITHTSGHSLAPIIQEQTLTYTSWFMDYVYYLASFLRMY
jgi:hypothetical protein